MCTGIMSSTNKTASDQNSKEVTNLHGSSLKCAFFCVNLKVCQKWRANYAVFIEWDTVERHNLAAKLGKHLKSHGLKENIAPHESLQHDDPQIQKHTLLHSSKKSDHYGRAGMPHYFKTPTPYQNVNENPNTFLLTRGKYLRDIKRRGAKSTALTNAFIEMAT